MSATATQPRPRLAVQAFWLTISKFIAAMFNIGTPILLVRLLAQNDYGLYKQSFLFTASAINLASFGVGVSAFYFMPRYPERGGQIALNIIIYNFIAGMLPVVVLSFYPKALGLVFRTKELEPYAFLLGVLVLVTLTSVLVELMPTALQDVRYSTIFVVGTQFTRAILTIAAALVFRSVRSLIIAAIVNQLVSIAVLIWYLYGKFGRFWSHFDWPFFRQQLAYALPLGLYGMMWVIRKDLDKYFVSAFYRPADYAIYAIGWLEAPLISLFLESIVAVLVVRISALQHEDRKEDIRRVMAAAMNRVAAIQFPMCALLLVTGRDLIVLLYTKTYESSARVFAVTILMLAIAAFIIDPVIRAYAELRHFVIGVRVVILLLLFATLGPIIRHFGMMGAAVTAVLAELAERVVVGWKIARTVDARARDISLLADLFKVLGVSAAAGVMAYLVRNLINPALVIPRIVVSSAVVGTIYLVALYWLRLPGAEFLTKERLRGLLESTMRRFRSATP